MRPTRGINFLASYTLGHAQDHVSGLNIGGESRPVLPVTIGDEASIDARARRRRRATRSSTCGTASSSASAPSCRRPETWARSCEHVARRLAAERHRADADRVPAHGHRRASTGIRYLTNRPNLTCDPNDGRAAHHRPVVQHRLLPAPRWSRKPAEPRQRRAQRGARTGLRAHRPVALQEHRPRPGRTGCSCGSRRSTCSTRRASSSRAAAIGTATFGRITQAEDGRVIQLAVKYSF